MSKKSYKMLLSSEKLQKVLNLIRKEIWYTVVAKTYSKDTVQYAPGFCTVPG